MADITVKVKRVQHVDINKALKELDDVAVEVGVFKEAGEYPNGTSIAEVAAYQEFGTQDMPAQPWMRLTMIENKADYIRLQKKLMLLVIEGKITSEKANQVLGGLIAKDLQEKAPVDTGTLKDAITWKESKD